MIDFGALIMPSDLLAAIVASNDKQGWLGGARLKSERVFVVTSAKIGEENKVCNYFDQLLTHRSWSIGYGEPKEHLVEWRKIEFDLFNSYAAYKWFSSAELAAKLTIDPTTLSAKTKRVCVVECSPNKAPNLQPVRIVSESGMSKLQPMDSVLVPEIPEPFARMPNELTGPLRDKRVTIVGVGSGGSEIVLNLASAGVGHLSLYDCDRLKPENYIRHVLDRRDLGRTKVLGLVDAIRERTLPSEILTYQHNVLVWANEFRDSLKENRPDLIVCATDSRDSRRFLNLCAVGFGIPLIIAGILDAGRIGEVISILPRHTACYECNRFHLRRAVEEPEFEDRASLPYSDIGLTPSSSHSAVQRFDIGFVSSIATRAALQFLDSHNYARLPADYVVWGRERSQQYAVPFTFEHPLSLNYVSISRRSNCPICGDTQTYSLGLSTDARVAEIIARADHIQT